MQCHAAHFHPQANSKELDLQLRTQTQEKSSTRMSHSTSHSADFATCIQDTEHYHKSELCVKNKRSYEYIPFHVPQLAKSQTQMNV